MLTCGESKELGCKVDMENICPLYLYGNLSEANTEE